MSLETALLHAAVTAAAFLYGSVGHGGASAYLAILALWGAPQSEAAFTALVLNILVAGTSRQMYARAGHFSWRLVLPFLAASIPAAMAGATVQLSPGIYHCLLGLTILAAACRLAFDVGAASEGAGRPPLGAALALGAAIGTLSGMIGIGGGIFLSPILLLAGWAGPKETGAASACFIVINSIAGLIPRLVRGDAPADLGWLTLLAAAFAGGVAGSWAGAQRWSSLALRRVLAAVLLTAGGKLLASAF